MAKVQVSAGKRRNLQILADAEGKFRMMAIDQRGSLKRMLAKALNKSPDEIAFQDMATVKKSIVKMLSPYSSATLIDPVYGYPYAIQYFPRNVGLLLAYEETGYDKAGTDGTERKSRLIKGWSAEKAKRAGANAIKLLVYYRPDATKATLDHQHNLIKKVGEDCEKYDLPYLLELVAYPLFGDEFPKDKSEKFTPIFAKKKPDIVIKTAAEFSKPEYKVDILKIEFPAELKYAKEYCDGVFDGRKRQPLYDLCEVEEFCYRVNEVAARPWVILSAGVEIDEFVENVRLATQAGASGFLGGRAIWQGCTKFYPDVDAMEEWLATTGAINFKRLHDAFKTATPWFDHKMFGGYPNIELAEKSSEWYQRYEEFAS